MATYPWLAFSSLTLTRQRQINMLAIAAGRCPPVTEDGKLGPNTCGAADPYVGVNADIADMKKSCQRSTNHRGFPCQKLPWNVKSNATITMQAALNTLLQKQGFCELSRDGILGPTTCAAAKRVIGSANSQSMGCQTYGTLNMCGASADTSEPIADPIVVTPPALKPSEAAVPLETEPTRVIVTPNDVPMPAPIPAAKVAPVVAEPAAANPQPIILDDPIPTRQPPPVVVPTQAPTDKGMTTGKWAILGVGVIAVGAGTYFLLKKK